MGCLCVPPNDNDRCTSNTDCTGGGTCSNFGTCQVTNTGDPCSSTFECTGANGEVMDASSGTIDVWPGPSQACLSSPGLGDGSHGVLYGGEAFGPLVVVFKDAAFRTTTDGMRLIVDSHQRYPAHFYPGCE